MTAFVRHTFAPHALADAGRVQQVDGALLQHAGAHGRLDFFALRISEHHRLDAAKVQQDGASSKPAGPAPMIPT
jgi:hypothetical protein